MILFVIFKKILSHSNKTLVFIGVANYTKIRGVHLNCLSYMRIKLTENIFSTFDDSLNGHLYLVVFSNFIFISIS